MKSHLLIEYLEERSIYLGLHVLRFNPRLGVEVIIELLLFELVFNQNSSKEDLLVFYDNLFQFNLFQVVDNDRYPAYFSHNGQEFLLKIFPRPSIKD